MILAIRTDKPEAELYIYQDDTLIDSYHWHAHRELADTLLTKIKEVLKKNNYTFRYIKGVIIFTGEGSFTGLRIGTSVANALAYSLEVKIADGRGNRWLEEGLKKLKTAKLGDYIVPSYNSEPNITKPNND